MEAPRLNQRLPRWQSPGLTPRPPEACQHHPPSFSARPLPFVLTLAHLLPCLPFTAAGDLGLFPCLSALSQLQLLPFSGLLWPTLLLPSLHSVPTAVLPTTAPGTKLKTPSLHPSNAIPIRLPVPPTLAFSCPGTLTLVPRRSSSGPRCRWEPPHAPATADGPQEHPD